jgi:hypothetical protein
MKQSTDCSLLHRGFSRQKSESAIDGPPATAGLSFFPHSALPQPWGAPSTFPMWTNHLQANTTLEPPSKGAQFLRQSMYRPRPLTGTDELADMHYIGAIR